MEPQGKQRRLEQGNHRAIKLEVRKNQKQEKCLRRKVMVHQCWHIKSERIKVITRAHHKEEVISL